MWRDNVMARADLINKMYSAHKTPLDFQFQSLVAPPLLSLLSPYDLRQLYDIARDPKLSAKLNKKLEYIKSILQPRGFVKFHSGTNRVVYRFLEDQSFLIKIALDKTGLSDNPSEFKNQFLLAPFVTRVFESTPDGAVGLFERVEPITSRQEFISIAEDVFDLLNDKIIGEYVLEDIGTDYFMNWGIRLGFGPVLLDFPYCYKLDGNKLYCNIVDPFTRTVCGGAIDYDMGFNNLVCTKCGAKIFAKTLQTDITKQKIIIRGRKEHSRMKVQIQIPGQKNVVKDTEVTAKTYAEQVKRKKKEDAHMGIEILNTDSRKSFADEAKELARKSREAREAIIPEENEKEESHNRVKHQYVPKASAPFGRQEESTAPKSYVDMNREDEEEIYPDDDNTVDDETTATDESVEDNFENEDHPDGEPYYADENYEGTEDDNHDYDQSEELPAGVVNDNSRNYKEEAEQLIPGLNENSKGYPAKRQRKQK
jgi:DNA-directed RNA polymerase subunit RPC12/RpoP